MPSAVFGRAVALLLLAISAPAQATDEVEKLVKRRLTPGVVALFARHTSDQRIGARLESALADDAASVRVMAARIVALGSIASLIPAVRGALAKEADADAAREEIRALCALGGPVADPEALDAAKRFSPSLDGAYAILLARLRGSEALPLYFSTLNGLALSTSTRRAFFRNIVNRDGPDVLAAAGSLALSRQAKRDWEAVLAVAAEREAPLKEGVLIAALRGGEEVFRGEAAWYMAKTYRNQPPQNAEQVLEAVGEDAPPGPDAELRFGAEMLRRVLGKPAIEDEGWIACLETNPNCHLDSDFIESPLVELLTDRERAALLRRNERNRPPEARSRLSSSGGKKGPTLSSASKPNPQTERFDLRLVAGLPKGSTEDLISVGGCRSNLQRRWYSVAEIEFGPHGLPRHVSLVGVPSDADCRRTAETIFLLSAAPEDGTLRGGRGLYVALFDPDCLICNELTVVRGKISDQSLDVMRVRAKVVAPRLEKRVEPSYPLDARKQHQQGINVYEAIISPAGCVREVRVLKSTYPLLDLAGMEAIARWRYTPATLNGRPVSVFLTVTVTFSLRI